MCGIGLFLNCEGCERTIEYLTNRGPDFYGHKRLTLNGMILNLYSSVLSHQGPGVTQQPIISNSKILMWNGEIYHHPKFDHSISDSDWLMRQIDTPDSVQSILQLLPSIRGEFAFDAVFLEAAVQKNHVGGQILYNSLVPSKKTASLS